MGTFKQILFLVMPHMNGPEFTHYPGFLPYLSSIQSHVIPFRVHYEFSRNSGVSPSPVILITKVIEVIFICRLCKILDSSSKSYPFRDYSVKCDLAQKCRRQMEEIYMHVTSDGKYLYYYTDEVPFDELNTTLNFRTTQTLRKKKTPFIQLVLMTVLKSIPGIRGRQDKSLYHVAPWIRSDYTMEAVLNFKDQEVVPIQRLYYNFITCHGENSAIDFYAYIRVFDASVWVLLMLCMGSILFMAISISNSYLETGINMLGLLIHNASLNTTVFRKDKIRLLLAIWLFAAAVISTFYSDANTAAFVMPQRISRIESILEAGERFSIYTFVTPSVIMNKGEENLPRAVYDTEFGEDVYKWIRSRYPRFSMAFTEDLKNGNLTNSINMFRLQMLRQILKIYHR
ncbi:unnamed protein product [Orchesella dallaii]|uniref:Uncharacterized protein n=1 Tax=Orchesella dallaii TaxID=48710 RepID=A0ABP1RJY6_9HEXA